MLSDRELLELSAKACGALAPSWYGNVSYIDGLFSMWNPLTNDGDALRLAVTLGMTIDINYNGGVIAGNAKIACNYDEPEYGYQEGMGKKDTLAATRRAIVRVAAEIGKGEK